jgi:hypothetical protein
MTVMVGTPPGGVKARRRAFPLPGLPGMLVSGKRRFIESLPVTLN